MRAVTVAEHGGPEVLGVRDVASIQRLARRRPDWFHEDLAKLFDLLARGEIQPHVSDRVPLDRIRTIHERLAGGDRGKFVVLPAAHAAPA
jgi:NADPH:quinone reductase-like Zn-dependent oxidoreductase